MEVLGGYADYLLSGTFYKGPISLPLFMSFEVAVHCNVSKLGVNGLFHPCFLDVPRGTNLFVFHGVPRGTSYLVFNR